MADSATIFGARVPMAGTIGAIGEAFGQDFARVRMPYRADLTNSGGTFHGGALATLLDVALCCAARPSETAELMVVTIDLSVHFIASSDRDVIAQARCLKRGKSVAFSQGEVRSLDGELLATATATLKLVPRRRPA
jgi:uncharacterized protein (TIGR00369 family)